MRYLSFLFMVMLPMGIAFAQNAPVETQLFISSAEDPITLDGILNEPAWEIADIATDFYQNFPADDKAATSQVEVRTTFDADFMYFGIVCYDVTPGPYIVASLKRDFSWRETENISIYLDPFNDRTNGFNFSLSPYNVQREGLISGGVEISDNWDNKWYSKVTNYEDRWVAEIAIPFKTIRYKEDLTEWNLQFIRNDLKTGQRTSWINVKQQFRPNNLAFAGKLIWKQPPPPSGVNISLIPYVLGRATKDSEAGTDTEFGGNAGFDAKVAISSSLNLDLTVNPDFSQVEVDQQVANLQRFELFFPEKRQFFLENSDLFANSGFPPSRPFFSRRIGIAQDTSDNSVAVPILFGARLSGKINKDWRIGILDMQTASRKNTVLPGSENSGDGYNLPGQNYMAAVVQRQLWARSNIGAIFVNRQATDYDASDTTNSTSAFNRIAGVDFNFATLDDTWQGKAYFHTSIDPERKKNAIASGLFVGYKSRHWDLKYYHNYVGRGYNAEVGYVPRNGTFGIGSFESNYIIYPEKETIVTIKPGYAIDFTFKENGVLADTESNLNTEVSFSNTSSIKAFINQNFTRLFDEFDPTNSDGVPLPAGSDYTWFWGALGYSSDNRKAINYDLGAQYGGFYNGQKFSFIGNVAYNFRPYGSIAVSVVYNDVELPDPYNSRNFWLIGPRLDLTFTNSLFLTTFVQYNEQAENININARFQWRFAPVSDLFVVYTDNYFPEDFIPKNRAVVIKLSYWFNL